MDTEEYAIVWLDDRIAICTCFRHGPKRIEAAFRKIQIEKLKEQAKESVAQSGRAPGINREVPLGCEGVRGGSNPPGLIQKHAEGYK